jgi:hypothetical protein
MGCGNASRTWIGGNLQAIDPHGFGLPDIFCDASSKRDFLREMAGEAAPAESGMAHLVNHRMGKNRSMRWSAEGAHRLLQVRCAVLDGQLERFFREWFPAFRDNLGSLERAM